MKFERIYSPAERIIKIRLNSRRASIRYRQRHPDRKPTPHAQAIYRRRWKYRHPDSDQIEGKRKVRMLERSYLVQLLKQHGRPITPETITLKRAELQTYRTRKMFRMIYATNNIS